MTHLRSSSFAVRATPDRSSFGDALGGLKTIVTTTAAILIGGGTSVLACPLCFGADETPLIDGAKLGVLVMLGVLFAVQAAFVAFFLYLRKHAKENADIELDMEWLELQRGSRTS